MKTEKLSFEEKNFLKSLIINFSYFENIPFPNEENLKYFAAEFVRDISKEAFKRIKPEYKNFLEEILKKIED